MTCQQAEKNKHPFTMCHFKIERKMKYNKNLFSITLPLAALRLPVHRVPLSLELAPEPAAVASKKHKTTIRL